MIQAIILRKLKAMLFSSTIGVSGVLLLGAAWVTSHPDIVSAVAPRWGGSIVAGTAFLVAVARARSL